MDRLQERAYQATEPGHQWPEDERRVFDALGVSHLTADELLRVARTVFMAHAVRVQPDVLLSLFPSESERVAVGLTEADRIFDGGGAFTRWTETRRATREIFEREWHERFGLPGDWCWHLALAAASVHWPCRPPDEELGALFYATMPTLSMYDTTRPLALEAEWIPSLESREAFVDRITRAAEAACDRIVIECELVKVPAKLNVHLAWLARYTVGNETFADMARGMSGGGMGAADERSQARKMNDGAQKAAALIGLTLPYR